MPHKEDRRISMESVPLTAKPQIMRPKSPACSFFRQMLHTFLFAFVVAFTTLRVNAWFWETEANVSLASCFFPLGGGAAVPGRILPQKHVFSSDCLKVLGEYFKKDGAYVHDTKAAIATGDFILKKKGTYNQMVVFDIDETVLSNIPYYEEHGFDGYEPRSFTEWMDTGKAPAIAATLAFYRGLRESGYSVGFISGRGEASKKATKNNLKAAGYGRPCKKNPPAPGEICYEVLVFRPVGPHVDATIYKSETRKKLMDAGFEIIASIGDQWSDISGEPRPSIIIKLPNPLYYVL